MRALAPFLAGLGTLPPRTRTALAAALALLVAAALAAALFAHPARAPLIASRLHADQMTEVETTLAAWNVPFTPVDGNIVLDASRRGDVLLRLSLAGIPHAHVATTAEALAGVGVLTPQSVIDAQARSGLAGEIELGLRSLDGVEDARVIVAPASSAEFADQQSHQATASVRLHVRPGVRLSSMQVAGIRAFVAASVPQLDPAHVTIVDDLGVALGGESAHADDARTLEQSLQSALDAAFGAGTALVRVTEERTQSATERRDDVRVPAGGAAIVHALDAESYDDGAKRYRKSSERDDRGSETRHLVTKAPAGALMRISTAVFIDASRAADLARVRELAAATVGYDARRGDTLTVAAVDFHRALQPRRDAWMLVYGALVPLLPTLAIVIGVLLLAKMAAPGIVALVRAATDRAAIAGTTRTIAGYAPAQVRGALAHEPPHAAAAIISALPAATAAAVLELYPAHEREAIVRRMQRAHGAIVPDISEVIG